MLYKFTDNIPKNPAGSYRFHSIDEKTGTEFGCPFAGHENKMAEARAAPAHLGPGCWKGAEEAGGVHCPPVLGCHRWNEACLPEVLCCSYFRVWYQIDRALRSPCGLPICLPLRPLLSSPFNGFNFSLLYKEDLIFGIWMCYAWFLDASRVEGWESCQGWGVRKKCIWQVSPIEWRGHMLLKICRLFADSDSSQIACLSIQSPRW